VLDQVSDDVWQRQGSRLPAASTAAVELVSNYFAAGYSVGLCDIVCQTKKGA
jgi:hypothetical protein